MTTKQKKLTLRQASYMGQLKVDGVYPVYGSMTSGFMRITWKDGPGFFCDALPSSSGGEEKTAKKNRNLPFVHYVHGIQRELCKGRQVCHWPRSNYKNLQWTTCSITIFITTMIWNRPYKLRNYFPMSGQGMVVCEEKKEILKETKDSHSDWKSFNEQVTAEKCIQHTFKNRPNSYIAGIHVICFGKVCG